jgi:pSer/pThr/pTyr-binding forkhead associated (FHA) protein/S1-C subfamily serine protease
METLRIRWAGGEASFEPGTTVRVGRDVDAEVQLRNTNLSRRHVEITHTSSGWVLRDVGSAQGTWRDGRQVQTVDIRGTVQVTLGREGRGEVLTLEASAAAPPSIGTQEPPGRGAFTGPTQIVGGPVSHGAAGSGGGEGTVIVGAAGSNRPGGALRAEALAGATVVTGDVLNIECAGRSYSFNPGKDVSIGRDADCDIVSHNPTVSRRHARITHNGSGWTLRDEGSSGGTFVDGERITEYRLAGSVAVWLGDVTTGERLVVVASGTNPKKPGKKKKAGGVPLKFVVAGAAVALALVIGIITMLAGGDDDAPNNDLLGRATVRLEAGNLGGSGTIIDAKLGLILTNAHVVAPDALGTAVRDDLFASELDPSVGEIKVLVAPALDKAAQPRFIAEVVAVDGYLDLAVIKITKTTGGDFVEPDDLKGLAEVPIGDSKALSTGDHIDVFGYPAVAQTTSVTLTEGVVSGPVKDDRIGSNRGMLNISADIRHGNSGGLAVNSDGELVGVPTLSRGQEDSAEKVSSMRPSEFAKDLIDAARKGDTYESPYIRPLTSEEVSNFQWVEPNETGGIRFECTNAPLTSAAVGAVGVSFSFKGFEAGEHQDMAILVWDGDVPIGFRTLNRDYPVKWPADEGCATITIPIDTSKLSAAPALSYTIGIGPGYTPTG